MDCAGSIWKCTKMKPRIPNNLLAKASQLCKLSCRPVRVKLVLKDGRTIYDMFVDETGEIVMTSGKLVFGERDLRFRPSNIVDVVTY